MPPQRLSDIRNQLDDLITTGKLSDENAVHRVEDIAAILLEVVQHLESLDKAVHDINSRTR